MKVGRRSKKRLSLYRSSAINWESMMTPQSTHTDLFIKIGDNRKGLPARVYRNFKCIGISCIGISNGILAQILPERNPANTSVGSPWNAGTPGVGNVGPLKIQGLPVTCSARDRPHAVCCVAEGLRNRPDFRSWHDSALRRQRHDGGSLIASCHAIDDRQAIRNLCRWLAGK